MSTVRDIVEPLVVVFIIVPLVGFFALSYFLSPLCGEDVMQSALSPNGKQHVVVYRRGCGATTGYYTHLNLEEAGSSSSSNSNGVIEGEELLSFTTDLPVSMRWKDDSTFEVEVSKEAKAYRLKLNEHEGLKVNVTH